MYEVLESYKRFDQKNNMAFRQLWDPSLKHIKLDLLCEAQLRHMERAASGFTLRDFALAASAGVIASSCGTSFNRPDSGLTSWEPLPTSAMFRFPKEKPIVHNEAQMTDQVKRIARFFGAELVGVARLDARWVYSHHYLPEIKESVPVDIDERWQNVISMIVEMDFDVIGTAPSAVHMAETMKAYSKMAVLVSSVSQFIRQLGYLAIPSLNDTALNVPIAVDAGLGQLGRHGLLISPQYGPRQRLCKIITDLPLKPDSPRSFGVTEFCAACNKCTRECPAQAIWPGEITTEVTSISNSAGVMKWPLNAEKCRAYWDRIGTSCGVCLRVCPFNKKESLTHTIGRWLVKHVPSSNRMLLKLDDMLGYGKILDSDPFWRA